MGVTLIFSDRKCSSAGNMARAEQMVLLQGEPAEVSEWFKVDTGVGNVRMS